MTTDLRDQLRAELRRAADRSPSSAGDGIAAVRARVERRAALARRQRGLLVAVLGVVALGAGVLAVRSGDGHEKTTAAADATPRDGVAGWREIAPLVLGPRSEHQAIAVGGQVLVFDGYASIGGGDADGAAIYDPEVGRWRTVASPPVGRWTWTVGAGGHLYAVSLDRGKLARYDVAADSWTELADPGFAAHSMTLGAVWTGSRLLVVVQDPQAPEGQPTPAQLVSYDPGADRWTHLSEAPNSDEIAAFNTMVWTGDSLVVASTPGASGNAFPHLSLLRWSQTEGWTRLTDPPLVEPNDRGGSYFAWTGTELVVGGGTVYSDQALAISDELSVENREPTDAERTVLAGTPALDAAAWSPATDTWRSLPDAPVGTMGQDWRYPVAFTDHEVAVWELGADGRTTGRLALLDPATGAWRLSDRAPGGRRQDVPMTWTGHELVIAGGEPTDGDPEPMSCCRPSDSALSFTP